MTDTRLARISLLAVVILFGVANSWWDPAMAQDAGDNRGPKSDSVSSDEQKKIAVRRQARMQKFAASHVVRITGSQTKVQLHEKPIFFWSNPERENSVGGALHMWVQNGRPIATIGLWTYKDTKDSYEFQSLSENSLSVSRNGTEVWAPTVSGLQFKPLNNSGSPATSKAKRLTQMRQIIRKRFSSGMHKGGTIEPLRLLPQPIYRYEEFPPDVTDGAVFSFANGTDPETFLLMEARTTSDGKPGWFYAFGNQTSASVIGRLDDEVIWSHKMGTNDFKLVLFRGE